jgi:hypothetical protein
MEGNTQQALKGLNIFTTKCTLKDTFEILSLSEQESPSACLRGPEEKE